MFQIIAIMNRLLHRKQDQDEEQGVYHQVVYHVRREIESGRGGDGITDDEKDDGPIDPPADHGLQRPFRLHGQVDGAVHHEHGHRRDANQQGIRTEQRQKATCILLVRSNGDTHDDITQRHARQR